MTSRKTQEEKDEEWRSWWESTTLTERSCRDGLVLRTVKNDLENEDKVEEENG